MRFDRVGVFTYSAEENTPAFDLPDAVPAKIMLERKRQLMEAQQPISLAAGRVWLGRELDGARRIPPRRGCRWPLLPRRTRNRRAGHHSRLRCRSRHLRSGSRLRCAALRPFSPCFITESYNLSIPTLSEGDLMATTKTADKKSTSKKGTGVEASAPDPTDSLANELIITLIHRVLVRHRRTGAHQRDRARARRRGDRRRHRPADAGNAPAPALSPSTGAGTSHSGILTSSGLSSGTLEELDATYGAPLCPPTRSPANWQRIYGRVREHFDDVAPRLLRGARFFPVSSGLSYGLNAWLLNTDVTTYADLLFLQLPERCCSRPLCRDSRSGLGRRSPWGDDYGCAGRRRRTRRQSDRAVPGVSGFG